MPESRRVLFVSSTNDRYGACRSLLDLMRTLPVRGYEPLVALNSPGPFGAMLDEAGIPWFPIHTRRWIGRPQKPFRLFKNRVNDLLTARRAGALAKGVDLIHSNTLSSPVGALIASRMGLPHLWHMREAVDTALNSVFAYGWDASARFIDHHTRLVVANSRFLVEQTARYTPVDKLRLLYNGPLDPADADRPLLARSPLAPDRPVRLLLVGKVTARKAHAEALQALALVRGRGLDARLVLAGDGAERDVATLKTLSQTLGVADAVEWLGYVDVRPLYDSCDLSLLCGPRDPIPRVAVESLALGIPTVAVRSGGIPEVIDDGETGWLYDEGSAESLAAQIEEAVRTPATRLSEMRAEGHRRVYARFNSARYGDEAIALYHELGA